ncbi:MAG: sensor domain-containing protein [Acidimicrobiales bacterium]
MEIDANGLSRLVANIEEVVMTVDAAGTITWCSANIREAYGWAPQQLLGHNFLEFAHPDQTDDLLEAYLAVSGQELQLADDVYSWLLRAADGDYVPSEISVSAGKDLDVLGGVAATIIPKEKSNPLRSEMIRLVDNESRLVRLATVLLGSSVTEFNKALEVAAEELSHLMLVGRASIWRLNGDQLELLVSVQRDPAVKSSLPARLPASSLEEVAGGSLVSDREAILAKPEDVPPSWELGGEPWFRKGVNAALVEAMVLEDRLSGLVMIENTWGVGNFDATHFSAMRSAAAILGGAIGRHDAEIELQRRATTDSLTGLVNRWVATEVIDEWLSTPTSERLGPTNGIGIALLDLDRFKVINESLGHAAGDKLLVFVAERLSTAIAPSGGTLGRLGGDEFIAMWRSVAGVKSVEELTRKLVDSLIPPFTVHGTPVPVTASAGLVYVLPGISEADGALRSAEEAMYRAKSKGGNLIEFDDERFHPRLADQMIAESELRAAIEDWTLEAWYQGEWELETGRLGGAEALVRWNHPRRGMLTAAEFVHMAEDMGTIGSLGNSMLREAFSALAEWTPLLEGAPFVMRVNISAKQLRDATLVDTLGLLIAEFDVDPAQICLELTESTLLEDPEAAAERLDRIRALNIGLAIDDFGTGYSSLIYLKRLPLTCLKIDQAFVEGLPDDPIDAAVVASVVELAARLGMTVTAEGLTTEAQRTAVMKLGCFRAQGYALSLPEPAEDFRARLVRGDHKPFTSRAMRDAVTPT